MDVLAPLVVPGDVRALVKFLDRQGTFHFPTLPTGLFSAGNATHENFAATGYQYVWVRDNIHIAHAHYVLGDCLAAARNVAALLAFHFQRPSQFGDLIEGRLDISNPMHRPHIRFDGRTLSELPETWAHAQNDALGYLLWLAAMLIRDGWLVPDDKELGVLADIVHVLRIVRYWEDEDSGHWEETRKIEASSIGTVLAGLRELQHVVERTEYGDAFAALRRPIDAALLSELTSRGERALEEILPYECIQPGKRREHDAALLFLIYPLEVVAGDMAETIIRGVCAHLQGEHGIRRYKGDSYWCADYRELLASEKRTTDFSEDTAARDALLKPGQEAQWCLFDPILSIVYGRRFLAAGDRDDLERQRDHLRRSLSQLTPPGSPFGAYRCPESYFLERGRYVPNDITPLLWTQANLRLALAQMEHSLNSL
jgi:phosphorylase kinase alpha/beta subunit